MKGVVDMQKEKYSRAEMEVIEFECDDVITTSEPELDDDELEIII